MKLSDETPRKWLWHLFGVCLAADSAERETSSVVNAAEALEAPAKRFGGNARLMGHVGQMAGVLHAFRINEGVQ
jgi:hypothetical protein